MPHKRKRAGSFTNHHESNTLKLFFFKRIFPSMLKSVPSRSYLVMVIEKSAILISVNNRPSLPRLQVCKYKVAKKKWHFGSRNKTDPWIKFENFENFHGAAALPPVKECAGSARLEKASEKMLPPRCLYYWKEDLDSQITFHKDHLESEKG